MSHLLLPVLATWHIRSRKDELACPITIIPGHGTRLRDKGNVFFSLSERGKLHQARTTDTFWQHALRKTIWMPSEWSPFEGIWTNDDDTLAQLDPLMHGRLRWILFKPPFGSRGAVRPRSEQQPPLLLRAEQNEMIHRSRESAAGCLGEVVVLASWHIRSEKRVCKV